MTDKKYVEMARDIVVAVNTLSRNRPKPGIDNVSDEFIAYNNKAIKALEQALYDVIEISAVIDDVYVKHNDVMKWSVAQSVDDNGNKIAVLIANIDVKLV